MNCTLEETAARRKDGIVHKYKLTFLTNSFRPQSSLPLGLFYQVTKVTEIIFKSHSWVQVQPKTCNKFKTKWKGNCNPQTCHWRRASQTTQSRWCLFAFFFTLAFKKCLVPYCSFLLPKRPWRTESSATKSFNHVQFVFNSSENWSRKVSMCHFVIFLSEHFYAVSHAFDFK